MIVVVVPFDGGFLDDLVRLLDLPVVPRVLRSGEAVFFAFILLTHVEHLDDGAGGRSVAQRVEG